MTRTRSSESGAAAVEMAILLPVIALLFFGAVEYGFAWSSASKVESASASAARVAAQAGDDDLADWEVLQAVRGSLGSDISSVDSVVVYDSTAPDGTVPAGCMTAAAYTSGGVAGVCSVYGSDDLASLSLATFISGGSHGGGAGNPCGGALADGWCPDDRVDSGVAPTMIGVHISYTHSRVTQYLPGLNEDIATHAVARLEPSA
ncbi:MAG: TadE family protein [Actinomycetota bacterium]